MQLFSQCMGKSNHRVTLPILEVRERVTNSNFVEPSQQPVQPVPVQPVQFENINALMPNITLNQVPNYEPSIYTSTALEELNESSLPMDPQQLRSSQLSNPIRTSQVDPLRETIHSMTTKEVLELMKLDSKDDEEKLQHARAILNKGNHIRSYTNVLGSGKNINRIKYNKEDNSLLQSTDNLEQNINVNLSGNGATFEGPKVKSSRLPSGSIDITIEGLEDENGNRAQVGHGHIHSNGDANGNIYA